MSTSLFQELRRRNVFKVGTAYLVLAWLVIQVTSIAVPALHLPEWVNSLVFLFGLIGFPFALFFAWAFEITPEGVKKEKHVAPEDSIANDTGRKIDFVIIAMLVLVIIVGGTERILFNGSKNNEQNVVLNNENENTQKNIESKVSGDKAATNSTVSTNLAANTLSLGVAVLPFENLSADPNNAFFAGGVHEDVLTYLSRIGQLRVISRTSMEKVAEKNMDVRKIGEYLDVSHVLEGSVRRAGNRVRVTVQLIKAHNDDHIWAENYDRDLDDIFAIQTEIAKEIANQLKTQLTPAEEELIESHSTHNVEAYDLFLKAREISRVWRGRRTFEEQIPLLEKAIELDPSFLDAEVRLLMSYGRIAWLGSDIDDTYRDKAKALRRKIVEAKPDSVEAYTAQGFFEYTINSDYHAALKYLTLAAELAPNNTEILLTMASSYKRTLQFDKGIAINKKVLSIDPEFESNLNEMVLQLMLSNRIDEALAQAKNNYRKFPNNWLVIRNLAFIEFSYFGNVDRYLSLVKSMSKEDRQTNNSLYHRLTVNKQNIDELLDDLDAASVDDENLDRILAELDRVELLTIVGRNEEAMMSAKKLLGQFEGLIRMSPSITQSNGKFVVTMLSYNACLAGDNSAFLKYQRQYQQLSDTGTLDDLYGEMTIAYAFAACGQIEKAWQILESKFGHGGGALTEWEAVLDPILVLFFSELDAFKLLKKRLEEQKRKREEKQPMVI